MKRVFFAVICVMFLGCPVFGADVNTVIEKANRGDANAQFELGRMFFEKDPAVQRYKGYLKVGESRAEEWYLKAAEQGHTEAQFRLGMMYFRGIGIYENWTKAREWLLKAADKGHTEAQYYIGDMYEFGMGGQYGVDEKPKAREYYLKAAEKGYAKAQFALGRMYRDGKGIIIDYMHPEEWRHDTRDYKKAEEWLLKAAEQGHASAQLNLGFLYKDGKGIGADYGKAMQWFLKAAEPRHFEENNYLEAIYDDVWPNGLSGTLKNEARKSFTLKAEMTQALALFQTGEMYEEGLGVNVDYRKALEFYEQAASLEHGYGGAREAKEHIEKLRASNTPPAKTKTTAKKNTSGTSSQKRANTPAPAPAKTYTPPVKPAAPVQTYTPPAQPVTPKPAPKQQNVTPQKNTAPVFANTNPKNRPRLSVLDFEDKSEERKANPDTIRTTMVTALHKTAVFNILERERLDDLKEEITLGQSGLVDTSTAVKIGKLKGAQYVMMGAITLHYYSEKASGFIFPVLGFETRAKTAYVVLDIRIVSVETGDIVYTESKTGEASNKSRKNIVSSEKMIGGLLDMATRNAVDKHVSAIQAHGWTI